MNSRLGRIALLANRIALSRHHVVLRPTMSLTKMTQCQIRKITGTSIAREQYLQGYKDNERFHGKKFYVCIIFSPSK